MRTAILATLVCLATFATARAPCEVVLDDQHPKGTAAASDSQAMIALAKTDIRSIATALDLYRLDNLRYPTTAEGLKSLVERPTDPVAVRHWHQGGYLRTLPKDPWGHDYLYASPSTHGGEYDVWSLGPPGANKTINTWAARVSQ
jgi:type II secretion system protein G